ncbi:MAG: tetratricopeptide (TPR) repeat protein [Arenicella sp.]|jgi:tetratricopeptide (TPR) repeat protein
MGLLSFVWAGPSLAQLDEIIANAATPGLYALPDELEAFWAFNEGKRVRARELAQKVIDASPNSYVAHTVLGEVEYVAEANFPRAVNLLKRALALFELVHSDQANTSNTWRWHSRILRKLAYAQGELGNFQAKLELLDRYNELYEPDYHAQRVWPLMKLSRFKEARTVAQLGIATGNPRQQQIALNALCAIAFELGQHNEPYVACGRAVDHALTNNAPLDTVDLINFAEASRSLFRLDEAERISLQATEHGVAWYRNPWSELAELYIRQARLSEALSALQQVPLYRTRRPVHVRESDRNENRRALASFFIIMGRAQDALRVTNKALIAPDRRNHTSRDPLQDRSVIALADRKAHLLAAQQLLEQSVGLSVWHRFYAKFKALSHETQAWMSGRRATRAVSQRESLAANFRIGSSDSAVMPPWLLADLISLLGVGPAKLAIQSASDSDERIGAQAYYNAFAAEVAVQSGDTQEARELIAVALKDLGTSERLMRARLQAHLVQMSLDAGEYTNAADDIQRTLEIDPGIFRRLSMALPISFHAVDGEVATAIKQGLTRSPRLSVATSLLSIRITSNSSLAQACLLTSSGSVLGCGRADVVGQESPDALANRVLLSFHQRVFSPKIDLSQTDAHSLDSSPIGYRKDVLEKLF